jgi:hypothetical protein
VELSPTLKELRELRRLALIDIQRSYRIINPILLGSMDDYGHLVEQCNKMWLLAQIARSTSKILLGDGPTGAAFASINWARTQLGTLPTSPEFKTALTALFDPLAPRNESQEPQPRVAQGAWDHD